jgi:hypothetical protein
MTKLSQELLERAKATVRTPPKAHRVGAGGGIRTGAVIRIGAGGGIRTGAGGG